MNVRRAITCPAIVWLLLSFALLSACTSPEPVALASTATPAPASVAPDTPTAEAENAAPTDVASATPRAIETPLPSASATVSPGSTPTASPTWTPTAKATPLACDERMPEDGLYTLVTREFGLSRDYVPRDLVPLSDYFGNEVTLGYPTEVRAAIVEPLQHIMGAMEEAGLAPQIISGFRSYSAQSLAFQKWLSEYPDWGSHFSAPPGHSEHQLGTTVDYGSPELKYMLGDASVQFHPAFAQTSEGQWLAANAAAYGFTMSYPDDAFDRTSFYYEPWHFRYVGRELALELAARGLTIAEYLQEGQPEPCLAD